MAKPFLLLQLRPEDATADNEYLSILKYGGLCDSDIHRLRIEQNGLPPELDLDNYSAIIVGGSPFDISTPLQNKSEAQLRIEQDFMRLLDLVVNRDFPFLGACSGNGLLGHYLGTPVTARYREPVSSAMLELTEAGRQDPLLEGFPDQIQVLLGHKEACDYTPAGAVLLLTGSACPVQMFRVGLNVYATQFHPEGDPKGFALRINVYKNHGYFDPAEAGDLIDRVRGVQTPYAQEILRRFVNRYRS